MGCLGEMTCQSVYLMINMIAFQGALHHGSQGRSYEGIVSQLYQKSLRP